MMNPSQYPVPFASAHVRASIVKILLIVIVIVAGMTLIVDSLSFVFPPLTEDQQFGDNPMGGVIVLVTLLFGVLDFVVYVATAVFFCMWLYRASTNVRVFDNWRRLDHSPGFAVG